MTWARTLVTGSGALAFRLEIEGWPYQFVTDARLAGTISADGRIRVAGMQADGITIGEDIDICRATLDARGCSITIADCAGTPTYAFSKGPDFASVLTANVAAGDTSFTVADATGLSAGDVVHVGTEAIKIGTLVSTTASNCTRGYWGSFAQAHYTADGAHLGFPAVSSRPFTARGRRARIFVYGSSDGVATTDNGTQIFLGRVRSDATIGGAAWKIQLESIASVLDQDLGQGLNEAIPPRGVYYPYSAPLVVDLALASDANNGSAYGTTPARVTHYGFHETQEAFIVSLNAEIATATAGWATTITAESMGGGGWRLVARTGAATPKYPYMTIHSLSDVQSLDSVIAVLDSSGARVDTVSTSTLYYAPIEAPVPRGVFGHITSFVPTTAAAALAETWPDDRIYIGGSIGLDSLMTGALCTWPSGPFDGAVMTSVLERNTGSRWVRLNAMGGGTDSARLIYGADSDTPTFKFVRDYGTGTLHTLLAAITSNAAAYMNVGSVPDLRSTPGTATTEDLDLGTTAGTSVLAVVTEATGGGTDVLTSLRQWFAYGPKKLAEVIAAELQLLGCILAIDSNGRLCIRRIMTPTAGSYAPTTIGASTLDVKRGFGTWQRAAFGTLNTVRFRHHYDAANDRYFGPTVEIRDPSAFSIDKNNRPISVEPVSVSVLDRFDRFGEAVGAYTPIAQRLLGIFGGPYATMTVPVNLMAFSVLCGDVVNLTHAQLPDPDTGTLGITARPCLVIGREWDMASGEGTLTLVTSLARVAGYAPSMLVVEPVTNVTGNQWTLTVSATPPSAVGVYVDGDATDWFHVGDKVRIWQWDSATPTTKSGTVDAVTATTVTVTFTAVWAGIVADVWMLDYGLATDTLAADQERYAYMSGTDHLVNFTTPQPAFQFAG